MSEKIPKSPNGLKIVLNSKKICYIDYFGSFWTLVDHFGTSATLPCFVIFGPKRAFFGPPAHMIEGWQGPKLFKPTSYMSKDCACATDPQSLVAPGHLGRPVCTTLS